MLLTDVLSDVFKSEKHCKLTGQKDMMEAYLSI